MSKTQKIENDPVGDDPKVDSGLTVDGLPAFWTKVYESNHVLEEPKSDLPPPVSEIPSKGEFVALGIEQISREGGEWKVNPETGLVIGPVSARKTSTE